MTPERKTELAREAAHQCISRWMHPASSSVIDDFAVIILSTLTKALEEKEGEYNTSFNEMMKEDEKLRQQLSEKEAELVHAGICNADLETELEMHKAQLSEKDADLKEWKAHAAISDKEFLQLSDWLIGNAEWDPKTGLINHAEKLKERVRDLIAKEAECVEKDAEIERLKEAQAALSNQVIMWETEARKHSPHY